MRVNLPVQISVAVSSAVNYHWFAKGASHIFVRLGPFPDL